MPKILIQLLVSILVGNLFAQTIRSGTIDGETWTQEGSPYHIIGDLIVLDLTIEPGVQILFDGNYRFDIQGEFEAIGTEEDSIYFQPDSSNSAGWQGINFNSDSENLRLSYCVITGASESGILINEGRIQIADCRSENHAKNGLSLSNSSVDVTKSIFRNNQEYGISIGNGGKLKIFTSMITFNSLRGVQIDGGQLQAYNCIVAANEEQGIFFSSANDSLILLNSTIANNGQEGLISLAGEVRIENSIFYFNGGSIPIVKFGGNLVVTYSDIEGGFDGNGNINQDPRFHDESWYVLEENSECIDAGNPAPEFNDLYFPPSLGDTRNDMGAYGGGQARKWFGPLFVAPSAIDFGNVGYDEVKSEAILIKNYGGQPMKVDTIAILGTHPNKFRIVEPPEIYPFQLDIAQSYPLAVEFIPVQKSANPYKANILISSAFGNKLIDLSGKGTAPQIFIQPSALDFSAVQVGDSLAKHFYIYNTGLDTLMINEFMLNNAKVFRVVSEVNVVYPYPSDPLDIAVYFKPDSAANYPDTLIISSNDPDKSTVRINLSGLGLAPVIKTSASIDFGTIQVYSDTSNTLSLQNIGNKDLIISEAQLLGENSTQFRMETMVDSLTIPAGADPEEFTINFLPQTPGRLRAFLQLINNDPNPARDTLKVILNGEAIAPELSVNLSIDFGEVRVLTDSIVQLPMVNNGGLPLRIDTLYIENHDMMAFSIESSSEGFTLEPDSDVHLVDLKFSARQEGQEQGRLVIISNDYRGDTTWIDLLARGVTPHLLIDSPQLESGEVWLGESALLNIVLYNQGSASLNIDSLKISGEHKEDFILEHEDIFLSVSAQDSDSIKIRFKPQNFGLRQADLKFISDDLQNKNVSIHIKGSGLAAFLSPHPNQINLGRVKASEDTTFSLVLRNYGNARLEIFQMKFDNDPAREFEVLNLQAPFSISALDSEIVEINFSPTERALRQVELSLMSNAFNQEILNIPMTAIGYIPGPYIYADSINFLNVVISGDSSFSQVIKNLSEESELKVDSLAIAGEDSSSFRVNSQAFSLQPLGEFINWVTFSPLQERSYSAELKIFSNDNLNNPMSVKLRGHGILDSSPPQFSFGSAIHTFVLNESHEFEVTIKDKQSKIQSADLYLRGGGTSEYQKILLHNNFEDQWSAEIVSDLITIRGLEFYIRTSHGGIESIYPPDGLNKPQALRVKIPSYDFNFETQKELYQKISLPFDSEHQTLRDLFQDELGAYDSTKYRIFDWDPLNERWLECVELSQTLPPGKALYLITKTATLLQIANCQTVSTAEDYPLELHEGWNMISVPFAFPVAWQDYYAHSESSALWFYQGTGWIKSDLLEPFKGYAFYAAKDTLINVLAQGINPNPLMKSATALKDGEWSIQIEARKGIFHDLYNYAGVREGAQQGLDHFDSYEPPVLGKFISLQFSDTINSEKMVHLSSDYRSPARELYCFDFFYESNFSGKTRLNFVANNLPNDYDYFIVSKDGNTKLPEGEITSSLRNRHFKLIIGHQGALASLRQTYKEIPKTFSISQNYPNPFNPVTKVTIQLPFETYINIDIFDVLGRKVKTLVDKELKEEGYYQMQWDGTNQFNQKVASGLYFLNFRTVGFSQTIKMILQR